MAKPVINTDQETLDMGMINAGQIVETRKLGEIEKANEEVSDLAQEELERWVDEFRSADDTEQVAIITKIHGRSNLYRRICGRLLDAVDQDIFSGRKSGYKSLNAWINENFEFTQMSKTEAYRCLSAYRAVGEEMLENIGVSKAAEIAQVKDEKVRERLIKAVEEKPGITIAEIIEKKEEIQKIVDKPKEKKREQVEARADEIKISILLNGPRSTIIEFRSQKERDIFNELLDLPRIKRQIAEKLVEGKYPSQK